MLQKARKIVPLILISLLLSSAITGLLFQIPKVVNASSSLLTGKVTDTGIDTDSNGLYDFLRIGVEVNITQPMYYNLNAQGLTNGTAMSNASSAYVNVGDSKYVYLNAGLQTVNLYFFGSIIHASGIINASHVNSISISSYYGNYEILNSVPLSQNYSYYQFDLDATLTGKVTDTGVDTDNDTDFDYLLVGVEINVTTAGDYNIYASGLAGNSISASGSAHLEPGLQTMSMTFSGPQIYVAGNNFSSIDTVSLAETGQDPGGQSKWWNLDQKFSVPLSREYFYTEFDQLAKLTGIIHDEGVDQDSDGDFDYLQIGVEVEVFDPGNYQVQAQGLANATNSFWIIATQYMHLDAGLNIVNMSFYGPAIYHAGIDPSMVTDISLVSAGPQMWLGLGQLHNVPLSQTYLHTEFDAGAYLTGRIFDKGVDTDGNGKYNYLEVSVEAQVEDTGTYEVDVNGLRDGVGKTYYEYYYPSSKSVYLTAGTNLINFSFYGPSMAVYQFSPMSVIQITLASSLPIPSNPMFQGWTETISNVALSRQYQYTEFDTPFSDIEAKFLVYPNGTVGLSGSYNVTNMESPNRGPQIELSGTFGKSNGLTTVSTTGKIAPPPYSSYQIPVPWYPYTYYAQASQWPFNSTNVSYASKYSGGTLNAGLNASLLLPPAGASTYPFNTSDFSFNAMYSGGSLNGALEASTTLPSQYATAFPFNVTDIQLVADYSGGLLKGNITLSIISGFPLGSLTLNFEANRTDITADGSVNVVYMSYPSYPTPIVVNETLVDQLIGNITSLEGTGPNSLYNVTRGSIEFLNSSTITKTPYGNNTGAVVTFDVKFHGDVVKLLANIMTGSTSGDAYQAYSDLIDSAIASVQSGSITLSYAKASAAASLHVTFVDDLKLLVDDLVPFLNRTISVGYPDYQRATALMELYLANATFHSLDSFNIQLTYRSATKTFNLELTAVENLTNLKEDVKKILIETAPSYIKPLYERLLNTTYAEVQAANSSLTYQNGEANFQSSMTIQGDWNQETNYAKNAYVSYIIESYQNPNYTRPVPWQLYFINQTQIDASAMNFDYKIAETSTSWKFNGLVAASPTDPVDLTSFRLYRFFNLTNEQYEPPTGGGRLKITVQGGINGTNIVTLIRPSTVPAPDSASEDGTLTWNNQSISGLRDLIFRLDYYTDIVHSGQTYRVITVSNGTVSPITFDASHIQLSLTVNGPTGTTGYANVSIPKSFISSSDPEFWVIKIGTNIIYYPGYNVTETPTTTYLHVTFNFSSPVTITIAGTTLVTEFPTLLIVPIFMALTIVAIGILMKRRKKTKL